MITEIRLETKVTDKKIITTMPNGTKVKAIHLDDEGKKIAISLVVKIKKIDSKKKGVKNVTFYSNIDTIIALKATLDALLNEHYSLKVQQNKEIGSIDLRKKQLDQKSHEILKEIFSFPLKSYEVDLKENDKETRDS
jgi:seryl-tRNA synthetase